MLPDVQNPPGKTGQRFPLLNGKPKTNMVPNVQNLLGEKSPASPPFECSRMVPVLRRVQRHTHKRIHMLPDVQRPPGKKGQRFPLLNGKQKTNMVPNVQNLLGEKSPAFPPLECSRMVPVLRGAQRHTHKRNTYASRRPEPPGENRPAFPPFERQAEDEYGS